MTKPKPKVAPYIADDVYAASSITAEMISHLHETGLMVGGRLLDTAARRLGVDDQGMHQYETAEARALLDHWNKTLMRLAGIGQVSTEHVVGPVIEALPECLHDLLATYAIECGIIDSHTSRAERERLASDDGTYRGPWDDWLKR